MTPHHRPLKRGVWTVASTLCVACVTSFDVGDSSTVTEPRILAVIAEPAEARPGEEVRLRAVVAAPAAISAEGGSWSFCLSPPPPGTRSIVSDACRDEAGALLAVDGEGALGTVPRDACQRFGPDPLPSELTETARPQAPDATGGFYIPVCITAFGQRWFHFQRLRCPLPDAPSEIAQELAEGYVTNTNPVI